MAGRSFEGSDEKQLYDAAAKGDTQSLHDLLVNDPLILDRVSHTTPNKTPLHVATNKGHLDFVKELLALNPQLAEDLDSHNSSALHTASARGHLEIVKELSSAAPEMCSARDSQGRNPVHIAAIKGHVEILSELIRVNPLAAREKIDRGLTVLHLCIKHDKLEALKILVPNMNDLINAKDDDGETILHMAARNNRLEIIDYLIKDTKIDKNAENSSGEIAGDIFLQVATDSQTSNNLLKHLVRTINSTKTREVLKSVRKKQGAVMVVSVLIATMAFQAGVNPPGGVWQDDSSHGDFSSNLRTAGTSIMAYTYPGLSRSFVLFTSLAFYSSLFAISMLISWMPLNKLFLTRQKLSWFVLYIFLGTMVFSIAFAYQISLYAIIPETEGLGPESIIVGILTITIFFVMSFIGFLIPLFRMLWGLAKRFRRSVQLRHVMVPNGETTV